MTSLIHNTVRTERSDYSFNTREEAEAFFIAVSLRNRQQAADSSPAPAPRRGNGGQTPPRR